MTDFGRRDGDMFKSTYDADENGIVDEAEALVAGADVDANKIKGVTVDDTDKGDTKVLAYNATSQNLEYETQSGGGPADAIRGDGTANRYLRGIVLIIANGTNASTLKCTVVNRWNGDVIAETDNVAKNTTTGHFTLSAAGELLYIEAAGLSGNVVYANGFLSSNASGVQLTSNVIATANDIRISLLTSATGVGNDLTVLVDTGTLNVNIFYITDA